MFKLFTIAAFMVANLSFGQVTSIPAASGSGASTFDNIGSGTNTSATMTCGAGCTLVTTAGVFRLPNGTSAPGTCTVGDVFFDTDATAGSNFYGCTSSNTWTLLSGSGSGASYPSALRCDVERTSGTRLTVFSGASSSQPCIVGKTSFTAAATLDTSGTAATGTYRFEVRDGVIYARLPGATTGLTASGLTLEASSTSFSAVAQELWSWDQTVAGTWDAGTGTDRRAWLTTQIVPVAGSLLTSSDSGGNRTLAVDAQNLSDNSACRSTTGDDDYECGTTPATTAYKRDRCYVLDADAANTGAATVNIDSLGVKSILRRNGDALSDGDITANKPITICYDNTQFIIQGDGGGSSTYTGNYFTMSFSPEETHITYSTVGTTVRAAILNIPFPTNLSRFTFFIDSNAGDQLGTSCTGGTCGISFGIYNHDCSTKLTETTPFTNSTATGIQSATLASPYAVAAGPVCILWATDSAALQISAPPGSGGTWTTAANQGTARNGTCSGTTTGNGASLVLPNSCGTLTGTNALFNLRVASN